MAMTASRPGAAGTAEVGTSSGVLRAARTAESCTPWRRLSSASTVGAAA